MDPIILLREVGLLEGSKTALDVGARDGRYAVRLAELGMQVDAIDINEPKSPIDSVNFQKISAEDFLAQNTKLYDVVIARHVVHMPSIEDPKQLLLDLNAIARVFFFTCFGPQDGFGEEVNLLAHDEVLSLFPPNRVRHRSEAFQTGKAYGGHDKFWHINTFVIDNR